MRSPLALALLALAFACHDTTAPAIRVDVGPAPADQVTLVPRASLAEYIEISATESALLLTLTSDERSCEGAAAASEGGVAVSLRVVLPGSAKLEPGSYPILASPGDADKPHVLPTVKLHGRRLELLPGGSLELRAVDLSAQGSLEGLLKFEFPGDAEHPATRVSGPFMAHFCRINRLRPP
jgi:hypothetical protein